MTQLSAKSIKMCTMLEPEISEMFRSLAAKKGISTSVLLRSMIIDDLRFQGLMPEATAVKILKGA